MQCNLASIGMIKARMLIRLLPIQKKYAFIGNKSADFERFWKKYMKWKPEKNVFLGEVHPILHCYWTFPQTNKSLKRMHFLRQPIYDVFVSEREVLKKWRTVLCWYKNLTLLCLLQTNKVLFMVADNHQLVAAFQRRKKAARSHSQLLIYWFMD